MKFFDVALRADLRTEADLANLVYFGLEGALVVCGEGRPSDDSVRVIERFDETIAAQGRLSLDHQIEVQAAIGLRASCAPRRAHPEVTEAMNERAVAGSLRAVGPIEWPDSTSTCLWQFEAARSNDLPVLVAVPPRTGEIPVHRLREFAQETGLEASDIVLFGCDFTNVRAAVQSGFWLVADLSLGGIGWEAGADLAERFGERVAARMMLSVSGHSGFDVLAAARFAERVRGGKLKPHVVEGILSANAQSRFAPR
ncbi:MAG: putative metal-dependent TIM-barrel fold hydrolase [Bradymonadia bacterium]